MKKSRRIKMLSLLLALAFMFVGCSAPAATPAATPEAPAAPAAPAETTYITIGTAGVGGMNYPVGMAMAKIWNREIPGMKAVAIATNGSPHNIDLLRTKDVEVAVCRAVEANKAINGSEPYPEKMPWIRAITGGTYTDADQIFALISSGIESIADFKGKKIAVGPAGSGAEVDARETLAAYGLTYDDIKPQFVEPSQAIEMMENGLVDASILGLTMGNSAAAELMLTGKVKIIPITDEAFENIKKINPYRVRRSVPANTYPNQDYEVASIGAPPDNIICREELPEELVYEMTKAIYENISEMNDVSAVMKQMSKDLVAEEKDMLLKYHPGAKKYFLEQGWITE
ncbi:MAG: family transporter solute-binding subunit [Clostridia bacterium]|nr:family transporter solute-binding subunit [Clostridia bacterium]